MLEHAFSLDMLCLSAKILSPRGPSSGCITSYKEAPFRNDRSLGTASRDVGGAPNRCSAGILIFSFQLTESSLILTAAIAMRPKLNFKEIRTRHAIPRFYGPWSGQAIQMESYVKGHSMDVLQCQQVNVSAGLAQTSQNQRNTILKLMQI